MAEYLDTILEQTAAHRAPLEGSPTGADVFLEPELESAKAELDKLTAMSGGDVNWYSVLDTAEEQLKTRSKDLRLAIWMSVAGAETSGWKGLGRGLVVANGLIGELWEGLFPTRAKARANIVTWFQDRTLPLVEKLPIALSDADDVKLVASEIDKLNKALIGKMGEGFSGISSAVKAAKSRVGDIPVPPPPKAEAPPDASPAASSGFVDDDAPAPEAAPAVAGGVSLGTAAADAPETTAKIAAALVSLARSLLLADTARAWSFRLHRQGIWLQYEAVSVEGVNGPGAGTLLGDLRAAARWQELVVAGEEASMHAPLWLDPHRYVAHALERMGSAFVDARAVVGRDTTAFVQRNPWLLEARFADGTPVADPETVEWLRAEAKRWQLDPTAEELGRSEDREASARFAQARNLVAAGRHLEGLGIAIQLARRGADTRDRFRANIDVARLAIRAGAPDIARPILESLVATATAHALETWDPSLCARMYATLYRCLPLDAPDRAKVFEVLCRLDPAAALYVQGAAAGGPPTAPVVTSGGVPAPMAIAVNQAAQPFYAQPAQPTQAAPAPEAPSEETFDPYFDIPKGGDGPVVAIPGTDFVVDDY